MNLMLIKAKIPPVVVFVEDRKAYLNALKSADKGDIKPFIHFIAVSADKTMDKLIHTIEKDSK